MSITRTSERTRLRWTTAAVALLIGLGVTPMLQAPFAQEAQTIQGFEVPEFDRENRLRSMLFGDFARLLPSGLVDITNMRIDFYDDDRQVEMRVTADTCKYDRNSRDAKSDSHIRIARENMIITGRGFVWNAEEGQFEIHNEAKVVLKDPRAHSEQGDAL